MIIEEVANRTGLKYGMACEPVLLKAYRYRGDGRAKRPEASGLP